jgi:UDP-N-acetylmuramate dehydrogenase
VIVGPSVIDRAAQLLGELAERDVPLAPLTTYRVGGPARLLVRAGSLDALERVATVVSQTGVEVLVIGRGSNLLVADRGFDGIAVVLGDAFGDLGIEGTTVRAGGSVLLPVLARRTAAAGLTGLEWAVGVPGSVGGAVRMNAGGHGSDVAASLAEVDLFDIQRGVAHTHGASALGLRFRGSDIGDTEIVLRATFELAEGDVAQSEREIAEIVRWRREHQPGGQNAGSVFVNPIPGELAAGQVIDELGLRGFTIGTASVSEKHANFIQASEGGRAADVRAVMETVRERVLAARGILLRSEIRLVGFDETEPVAERRGQAGSDR